MYYWHLYFISQSGWEHQEIVGRMFWQCRSNENLYIRSVLMERKLSLFLTYCFYQWKGFQCFYNMYHREERGFYEWNKEENRPIWYSFDVYQSLEILSFRLAEWNIYYAPENSLILMKTSKGTYFFYQGVALPTVQYEFRRKLVNLQSDNKARIDDFCVFLGNKVSLGAPRRQIQKKRQRKCEVRNCKFCSFGI